MRRRRAEKDSVKEDVAGKEVLEVIREKYDEIFSGL